MYSSALLWILWLPPLLSLKATNVAREGKYFNGRDSLCRVYLHSMQSHVLGLSTLSILLCSCAGSFNRTKAFSAGSSAGFEQAPFFLAAAISLVSLTVRVG